MNDYGIVFFCSCIEKSRGHDAKIAVSVPWCGLDEEIEGVMRGSKSAVDC
ncbi:MAG: hypothetical protein U9N60_03940 [Thermodesulfobacteriota bacterium]|nr:hypothetical protein [Thermodesulfobacteriota bacterium]